MQIRFINTYEDTDAEKLHTFQLVALKTNTVITMMTTMTTIMMMTMMTTTKDRAALDFIYADSRLLFLSISFMLIPDYCSS